MIDDHVHSFQSGRVSGWVTPKVPNAASSTCSRKNPDRSARTMYPTATIR